MCQTNKWNSISSREKNNIIYLTLSRSDGVTFSLMRSFANLIRQGTTSEQTKNLLDWIEEFRNCKCKQGQFCDKHISVNLSDNTYIHKEGQKVNGNT